MAVALIVDCDPGHDDALALLLATGDARAHLLGVTTVAGNQTLTKTTRNAQRILALAGATDVPVAAGCDRPLIGELTVAEDVVLRSGLPLTMVGLNVTHRALATDEIIAEFRGLGTRLGAICAELMTFFAGSYRREFGFAHPPVHDPVAVAWVLDPAVVPTVPAPVVVELHGLHTRGATVVDLHRRTENAVNVEVAVGLEVDGFWRLLMNAVRRLGSDSWTS